ncbi:phage major capsid protein [Sutcliffiella cohnii]|uniref:phage major capsid protein n=1 Tax=Sutcliffiella cohnii TaxID=33932 RepID=UPI002E1C53B5|nr:phage major capsid protein [Sutcliffiella cohnii]MED4016993.1 phage major capsid protein [Sutcliffiella cohnii]
MLKQLRLAKELELKRQELKKLEEREATIQQRSAEFQQSIEEVESDDDLKLLDEEIEKLEGEATEVTDAKTSLQSEIETLENDLNELNERSKTTKTNQKRDKGELEGMNNLQIRELLKTGEYYKRSEVKEFYEQFKNLRSVAGGELTIPEIVVNRIMDIMGDFTTLYPLVDKIKVKGTTRILVDTDTSAATWMEQKGALPQGDVGTITHVDFDGFKVGKVTFVDNYLLQDSIINLDAYVVKKIARAIAKALDSAIVKGQGAAQKQPEGVIPALSTGNKVTVQADDKLLKNLVKQLGLIDTGADSVGEIVAVMHRKTYYNRLVEFSIQVNSEGNVVGKLPNLKNPDLVGLRVVFNNNLSEDEVLFGEFSQYTLIEREDITIDHSQHVKFSEDQMAFRGKGRFDGKPVNADAFVLVTIAEVPEV